MIAVARYLLSEHFRSRRFVAPMLLLTAGVVVLYAQPPNPVLSTAGTVAAYTFPCMCWGALALLNTQGDPLTTFSIKPGPDASVHINGKETKFTELNKGETISFYVSEDRLSASEQPGPTEESWAVLPPK